MRYDILKPESVKLIIDCSEKPRDNALFYAFQVFKLFTHRKPGRFKKRFNSISRIQVKESLPNAFLYPRR